MNYTGGSTRNGFTSLKICPAGIRLYASCMDNTIYTYNISTYKPDPSKLIYILYNLKEGIFITTSFLEIILAVAEFFGYQNSTYYVRICLSPDGQYLLSGSSDIYAYLWRTNKPGSPLVRLSGHAAEVTCVAWCRVGETKVLLLRLYRFFIFYSEFLNCID